MINSNIKGKGFTLVELLAVIILLSILVIIIAKNFSGMVEKSKERSYQLLLLNIENASRSYANEHLILENISKINPEVIIYIEDLVNEGYLKLPLVDARVDKNISSQSSILIALEDGEITYTVTIVYEQ